VDTPVSHTLSGLFVKVHEQRAIAQARKCEARPGSLPALSRGAATCYNSLLCNVHKASAMPDYSTDKGSLWLSR